jgi:hypothetical protein
MAAALLVELPSGDFVDPDVITDIQYFAANEHGNGSEERVIVLTLIGWISSNL